MKLKLIEKILKTSSIIYTFKVRDIQWVGNEFIFFPLPEGLSNLSIEEINIILNIDKTKHTVKPADPSDWDYCFLSNCDFESQPGRRFWKIVTDEAVYMPISTETGIIFVDEDYLKVFAKDKENQYDILVRYTDTGKPYIAVKEGMFIAGIINVKSAVEEKVITDFRELLNQTILRDDNNRAHYVKELCLSSTPVATTFPEQEE